MKWATVGFLGVASGVEVTPIQKVIQLLNDMTAKGQKEMQDEQVQFAAYKQFCDDTIRDKTRSIEEATEAIEKLTADEEKFTQHAKKLGREIAEATEDVANWEGDLDSMRKVREMEKSQFLKEQTDYQESVSALKRATKVLKSQSHDRKQAGSAFMQLSKEIPASKRALVTAFLSTDIGTRGLAAILNKQAPEANAYEFQSGGVVEMLEQLTEKFSTELADLQKAEQNAAHAFNMQSQEINMQIETAKQGLERDTAEKAKKEAAAADAKSDRQDAEQTKEADTKYKDDLVAECTTKAADFKTRQQLRADELDAIAKAVEIMSSDKVTGSGEKYLPQLVQTSFMQLRSSLNHKSKMMLDGDLKDKIVNLLNNAADEKHSRVLMQLAQAANAGAPFDKITEMIRQLITRLQEEAAEEAEHNGWCKTELAKNEKMRTQHEDAVATLSADVEALKVSIEKASQRQKDLTKAIQELDVAMAEATKLRNEEKEKNDITVEEAKAAQVAVSQALTVLRDFYAKAGTSTALLQQKPEIFDDAYTGMQGMQGGVVGMMEVIESDFARLEADTVAAEKQAQEQYDSFMTDSKVDKTEKSTQLEHTDAKKQDESQTLVQKEDDLTTTQNLLDSANAEFEKLKPQCIDTGVSYEERVAKRKAEIESLKEALDILSQEAI